MESTIAAAEFEVSSIDHQSTRTAAVAAPPILSASRSRRRGDTTDYFIMPMPDDGAARACRRHEFATAKARGQTAIMPLISDEGRDYAAAALPPIDNTLHDYEYLTLLYAGFIRARPTDQTYTFGRSMVIGNNILH